MFKKIIKGEIMKDKIEYVLIKLKETIFRSEKQSEVVPIIVKAINLTNNSKKLKINGFDSWATDKDHSLAQHLLFMFSKTKKIDIQDIQSDQFINLWDKYVDTEEYYQQIVSYMVNADDYIFGDRFLRVQGIRNLREANYMNNTINRWSEFSQDILKKQQYYSKIFSTATQLYHVIIKRT